MNVITKNTVVINGNTVRIRNIDFNAICELEDLGLDIKKVTSKTFSSVRCALAYHANIPLEDASAEIEKHIMNGGKLNDLIPLLEAIIESDFFKSLTATAENEK